MSADPCGVAVVGDPQVVEFVRSARQRLILVAPAVTTKVADAPAGGRLRTVSLAAPHSRGAEERNLEVTEAGSGSPSQPDRSRSCGDCRRNS
jgi:hypothetical protein